MYLKKVLPIVALIVIIAVIAGMQLCRNRDREALRVGILLPLTGPSANHGQDALNGLQMKLNETTTSGKPRIRLIIEDTKSNPATALSGFHKLVDIDGVSVIIGPISSSIVLGLAPEANRRQVVLFAIGASNPKISTAGEYVFRHALLAEPQSEVLAKYAYNDLNNTKMGFLYINDETGLGYIDKFRQTYKQLGGRITLEQTFDRKSRDLRTQLTKLKAEDVTSVFSPGTPSSTGYILKQSSELGYPCTVLAGYGVEGEDIITIAGKEAERLVYTSFRYDDTFLRNYQQQYEKYPSASAGLAYDALGIVIHFVHEGARSGDNFKSCFESMQAYQGCTGLIEFDALGDTRKEPIILKTVRNGKFVNLYQ